MARILQVLSVGYPPEVRAEKLVRSLRAAGHEVFVLARFPYVKNRTDDCRYLADSPTLITECIPHSPVYTGGIQGAIEHWKPDLIIAREMLIMASAYKAAKKFDIPLIMDMAEPYPEAMRVWKKYNENPFLRFAVHTLKLPDYIEKDAVDKADGIIVVCEENKRRIMDLYSTTEQKLCIAHNTPFAEDFISVQKGVSENPHIFGYHGYLTNDRGLDNFIRGFEIAHAKFPHIGLIISGTGPEEQDLRNIAAQTKCSNAITFTGAYVADDLPRLYSEIDFGITPYRVNGFIDNTISNKNFDYLLCGKPMLVSRAKALIRLIDETKAGIAVDCEQHETIAQGIEHILHSDAATMAKNGMAYAEKHYLWQYDEERMIRFIESYL